MIDDMVERVALALCNHLNEGAASLYEELGEDTARDLARVAIAAMREPTEAMVDAGVEAAVCDNAPLAWPAMIDAALATTPTKS